MNLFFNSSRIKVFLSLAILHVFINNVKAQDMSADTNNGFQPVLLKVEANYDQFQPGEILWLTCWWQNTGTKPSISPLSGFVELSFGHQRIAETTPKYHRTYWEPYPATNRWQSGEVWKTTIRCSLKVGWGGSYKITLGLCDENHLPVDIVGADGKVVKQVQVGQIEVGWTWGTPTIERMRKPWAIELNKAHPVAGSKPTEQSSFIKIGQSQEIRLCDKIPAITGIRGVENSLFSGNKAPIVTIRELATDSLIYSTMSDVKIQYRVAKVQNTGVVYHGVVKQEKQKLAEFDLNFKSVGNQLEISLVGIKEQKGFELLDLKLPSLLSLSGDDVTMVSFWGGGRLISLKDARPEGYVINYDTRNAAALIKANDQLVMESTCLDDKLILSVQENENARTANLGMILSNRIRGKGKMASVTVENDHKITIELLDKTWGTAGWQSVAKYFRKDLHGKNREMYDRALFYKTLATSGPEPPEGRVKDDSPYAIKRLTYVNKFKDISEQVRKMHNILNGIPQVSYVAGFEEGGFDNSYPFVYNTDQRAGTIDDLRKCLAEGPKYNAIIGLHDNYDDMALTQYYDSSLVAINEEGKPWLGWIWPSGLSHIIGMQKYAQTGKMQERVKKTIELYGVYKSHHLDVLTSEPLRYDFDPEYPASADKNHQGKLAIINEFNKQGIDLTSESLVHPFVGHIGHALWPREDRNTKLFDGDQYIPLVPFVYHGTIGYCGQPSDDKELLWCMLKGSKYFPNEDGISDKDIMAIYIQHIPVDLFYNKKMNSFKNEGDSEKVIYDEKSYITVDYKKQTYEIVCDGQLVGKNWTTFAPGFKEGTYLAYSKNGGKFDYPAPLQFNTGKSLRAVTLTREGEGQELSCQVINGRVIMDIPSGVPVKITNK